MTSEEQQSDSKQEKRSHDGTAVKFGPIRICSVDKQLITTSLENRFLCAHHW